MKNILIIVLFFTLSFNAHTHEYYFAFSEVEYNSTNKCLEITLNVSTHDIEHWINEKGLKIKELENHYSDSLMRIKISNLILIGFNVSNNHSDIKLNLIDYEVKKNGITSFYFTSPKFEIISPLIIRFDLLMDKITQQQNKLTFIKKDKKETYIYSTAKRENNIEI